jgi:hypothetical protein
MENVFKVFVRIYGEKYLSVNLQNKYIINGILIKMNPTEITPS